MIVRNCTQINGVTPNPKSLGSLGRSFDPFKRSLQDLQQTNRRRKQDALKIVLNDDSTHQAKSKNMEGALQHPLLSCCMGCLWCIIIICRFFHHDPSNSIAWFVNGCYTTLACGLAAVIMFFVISGFCIHYPYREKWSTRLDPLLVVSGN